MVALSLRDRLAEFMKRFGALDYLILLDTDANETVRMANQVLPIAAYPELDGSFTNFEGHVQRLHAAFDPPGEALSGVAAIARLGHAFDSVERAHSAEDVFAEMASSEAAFRGLSLTVVGPHGAKLAAASS